MAGCNDLPVALDTWEWHSREETAPVWPGRSWPLGATWSEESTNFAVYAPEATAMWVCVFDEDDIETTYQLTEHSLGIWHGAVPGLPVGTRYGLRAFGPWQPE
jgi:glycogen operon protein